jgi:3-oxoadipate CoA-transferase alpha subunit
MAKTIASLGDAVSGIRDGMTLMIGGFGGAGAPVELIPAFGIIRRSVLCPK